VGKVITFNEKVNHYLFNSIKDKHIRFIAIKCSRYLVP